jgi:hypothetical protein
VSASGSALDVALALSHAGKPDEAEAILRAIPDDLRAIYNLGWHDVRNGHLRRGFEGFNAGRIINVFGSPALPGPLWHGESLHGKTLLLNGEGGIGDEIINFRFAANFKKMGANVVVASRRDLAPMFSRHGVPSIQSDAVPHLHYDYWVPAMSACYVLDMDYADISGAPYLNAAPTLPKRKRLRIGVRWGGSVKTKDIEWQRKIPYPLIKGLCEEFADRADFFSFQRDNDLHLDFPGTDLSGHLGGWEATAGLLASMDLLITSCTSVAHASAAMGIPTWVMVPILPYYIWARPGTRSAWYDSVTLYRQTIPNSWHEPIEEIRASLTAL